MAVMTHELRNHLRSGDPCQPVLDDVDAASPVVPERTRPTATPNPEALIHTFKHQAKLLELLETKLGPEGKALHSALAEAQQILSELLGKPLPNDDEVSPTGGTR